MSHWEDQVNARIGATDVSRAEQYRLHMEHATRIDIAKVTISHWGAVVLAERAGGTVPLSVAQGMYNAFSRALAGERDPATLGLCAECAQKVYDILDPSYGREPLEEVWKL